MTRFRLSRARLIRASFPDIDGLHVLDLGGSLHFWSAVAPIIKPRRVTILNVSDGQTANALGAEGQVILYDGKTIPFGDQEVDLLICNSVIEHVPPEARAALAAEIRRVAKRYAIQTPAYECPLEPHFVAPFIHWLPRKLGRFASRFTPRALGGGRPATEVFDEVRLLRSQEMVDLFPGASMVSERFLGMPKSYLALGQT